MGFKHANGYSGLAGISTRRLLDTPIPCPASGIEEPRCSETRHPSAWGQTTASSRSGAVVRIAACFAARLRAPKPAWTMTSPRCINLVHPPQWAGSCVPQKFSYVPWLVAFPASLDGCQPVVCRTTLGSSTTMAACLGYSICSNTTRCDIVHRTCPTSVN